MSETTIHQLVKCSPVQNLCSSTSKPGPINNFCTVRVESFSSRSVKHESSTVAQSVTCCLCNAQDKIQAPAYIKCIKLRIKGLKGMQVCA